MELCDYHPCGLPGHQLPHAWITRSENQPISTRELVPSDKLLLLGQSNSWRKVRHDWIHVEIISTEAGGWTKADNSWEQQVQPKPKGALLVRPDNIIAYRFDDDQVLSELDAQVILDGIVRKILRL